MCSTVYPKIKSGQLLNSAIFHRFVVFWASILSCSSPYIVFYSLIWNRIIISVIRDRWPQGFFYMWQRKRKRRWFEFCDSVHEKWPKLLPLLGISAEQHSRILKKSSFAWAQSRVKHFIHSGCICALEYCCYVCSFWGTDKDLVSTVIDLNP